TTCEFESEQESTICEHEPEPTTYEFGPEPEQTICEPEPTTYEFEPEPEATTCEFEPEKEPTICEPVQEPEPEELCITHVYVTTEAECPTSPIETPELHPPIEYPTEEQDSDLFDD
ncbi:7473_t:CDS:1, partial [Acaulospora morrowiae]